MPRSSKVGRTSTILQSRAPEAGFALFLAVSNMASASSSERACASTYPVSSRLAIRLWRHSTASILKPAIVAASGCAPAQPAEAGREDPLARNLVIEVAPAHFGKRFVSALHDALAADVYPRPGRHLPVHGKTLAIEFVEVF